MSATPHARPNLNQLKRQAKELLTAFNAADAEARSRILRALPKVEGDASRLPGFRLKLTEAQLAVARENGFDSWPRLTAFAESGKGGPTAFLQAVLAVVDGDLQRLQTLLAADPALIHQRSPEAHKAQLLHYIGANGVENHLQRTPANAVKVCRALLAAGAEVDSSCQTYGGGPNQTPMNLLVSSTWPHRAGLQADLAEALLDGGAAVDGPLGDCAPLRTALEFGYTDTAQVLVRREATVQALDLAAGLGRVEELEQMWHSAPDVSPGTGDWTPGTDGRTQALLLACHNGQVDSLHRLLELGGAIETRSPSGGTLLHEAILWNHAAVVQALLLAGADPMAKHTRWGATALDLASFNGRLSCVEAILAHGAASDLEEALVSACAQRHVEVARRLLAAGADSGRALRAAHEAGNEAGNAEMVALLSEQ